jgi:hypothetical protein
LPNDWVWRLAAITGVVGALVGFVVGHWLGRGA